MQEGVRYYRKNRVRGAGMIDWWGNRLWVEILSRVVRVGLLDKVTCEQRLRS